MLALFRRIRLSSFLKHSPHCLQALIQKLILNTKSNFPSSTPILMLVHLLLMKKNKNILIIWKSTTANFPNLYPNKLSNLLKSKSIDLMILLLCCPQINSKILSSSLLIKPKNRPFSIQLIVSPRKRKHFRQIS